MVIEEAALHQRDWSRVEEELAQLMPRGDDGSQQTAASWSLDGLVNLTVAPQLSTETVLEQITKALQSDMSPSSNGKF